MNDLIAVLLDILDEYTTGDPADDTVEYDRLQLAQELSAHLWEMGYRKVASDAMA